MDIYVYILFFLYLQNIDLDLYLSNRMNLIYICVFFNKDYIKLLDLLIKSLHTNGNINKQTTDILIVSSSAFKPLIENIASQYAFSFKYCILTISTLFESASARLKLFNYNDIDLSLYEKILYLDTDILINNDLNTIFNLDIDSNKIYALEEGNIGHEYWGGQFFNFTKYNRNTLAFSSGILYFKNTPEIKSLFDKILNHIKDFISSKQYSIPICLEQPFIVYNSIINEQYNNTLMKSYIENNPSIVKENIIIYHFPGGPGNFISKIDKMTVFYPKLINRQYLRNNDKNLQIHNNTIPKILFQTAKQKIEQYVIEQIKTQLTDEWKYLFFNDNDIINFYNENPINELPNIIEKHYSLTNGAHRADLFRYYFIYLKGGFFLDSDAMIYENIENIIRDYNFVSVNSSIHSNTIFQGILGANAGNEIIKMALYNVYNTENYILKDNYHYFCRILYNLINDKQYNFENIYKIKLYTELRNFNSNFDSNFDDILDGNKTIFKHYWKTKQIPLNNNLLKFQTKYGILFLNKFDKYFIDVFKKNKYWDEENLYILCNNYVPIDKNILEIGGHSGTSTLFYAKYLENEHIIYCFEPQYKMFQILQENIRINNLQEKVKLFNNAVFCKNGVIHMHDNDLDGPVKGKIKLLEENNKDINYGGICIGSNGETVQCIMLDDNNLNLDNIGFIHCDAQGAESYIFSSAKELIKKNRPVILYENINLYGNYLYNIIKTNYPEFESNSKFNVKTYCIEELGYYCIDNFNNSNFDSLLIPYKPTNWNNYNKSEINNFDFRVLETYKTSLTLKRIGANTDGGYVIADGFTYDLFISCGIANDINFEDCFLDLHKNIKCIAFDGTIKNIPAHKNNIEWINKNIGFTNTFTTTNLKPYFKNYTNIFLKMDIEGSEFNWLESTTIEDLEKISQIVIEVHWPFDKYRCKMLEKLNTTHYIIHIHGNNYCDRDIPKHLPSGRTYDGNVIIKHNLLPEIKLPEVMEITYINKKLCKDINVFKAEIQFPTQLDYPNNLKAKDISFSIPIITTIEI